MNWSLERHFFLFFFFNRVEVCVVYCFSIADAISLKILKEA